MTIKHLVMDVDGVLNTGHVFYSAEGKMLKAFGPHDKDGIKIARDLGLTVDFITADLTGWTITLARLRDWQIDEKNIHYVKEGDRVSWMKKNFDLNEVAFIGDGYYDAPLLRQVMLGIAPASARKEAKQAAKFVTESRAGEGAVLDACLIIKNYISFEDGLL